MNTPRFVLHGAPRSRSFRILWLLEEAQVPYEHQTYDLKEEAAEAKLLGP